MRTGSLLEVAVVLKGLTFLVRRKGLSFREKRMLERAKFLLVSEIAEVDARSGKASKSASKRRSRALLAPPRPIATHRSRASGPSSAPAAPTPERTCAKSAHLL